MLASSQPPPADGATAPTRPVRRFSLVTFLCGILGGCLCTFMLLAATLFGGIYFLVAGCNSATSAAPEADYVTFRGEGDREVLRLELTGVITGLEANRWTMDFSSDVAVRKAIEAATPEDRFDALLLIIDSPGGAVTASDALYHALENFKAAKPSRKIIVMGGDIVASGAYYIAMQADWIRLQPTSIVGSIGVIVPGINAAGLAQKLGLQDNSIASGAAKDLNNPLKPINPAHTVVLQEVVDSMYDRFVALVAKGRKKTLAEVKELADGRVFIAGKAVALGLVDDVGYEDTIDDKLAELLGCSTYDLRIVSPAGGDGLFRSMLLEFPAALGRGLSEPLTLPRNRTPEYRW